VPQMKKSPSLCLSRFRPFMYWKLFRKNRVHLALVIDEHGSIQGTITLTDVLESIVGGCAGR